MLTRIRQILLTQYIGAIVTAFMLIDAVNGVTGAVGGIVNAYYAGKRQSVFGESHFDWGYAVPGLVRAVLYVGISYLLIRWLYLKDEQETEETDDTPAEREG